MNIDIAIAMVNGLGQMALFAAFFGLITRLDLPKVARSLLLGVAFGAGTVVAMMTPFEVVDGVIIDTRALLIGIGGAFAGAPAAIVAAGMAGLYRFWLGGAGMPMGLLGISLAAVAGVGWHHLWPREKRGTPLGLAVLGLMMSLHSTVTLFVPMAMPDGFYLLYFPLIFATCIAATQMLGWMMHRELKLIQRERSLTSYAFTDALTGIANRRAFDRRLTAPDCLPGGAEFGLVLIDIDHFKAINDRHGHDAGDDVLRRLALTLADEIRGQDFVARYGGEEFVLLLPATGLEASMLVAEHLRASIAALRVDLLGVDVSVTGSFGVATSKGHLQRQTIIAAADLALYKAKQHGRNRVESAVLPMPSVYGDPTESMQLPKPASGLAAKDQAALGPLLSR